MAQEIDTEKSQCLQWPFAFTDFTKALSQESEDLSQCLQWPFAFAASTWITAGGSSASTGLNAFNGHSRSQTGGGECVRVRGFVSQCLQWPFAFTAYNWLVDKHKKVESLNAFSGHSRSQSCRTG